jgi:alanine-glyoxylate transaminase/(R)-3-amino-2-methylpropionate-pyruvate transaminase
MPLGAITTTTEIADSLKKNTISTFGGNPVSCAAASATLNIIERDNLTQNAEELGTKLREGLDQLKQKYPRTIGDVRGMGLMQAKSSTIVPDARRACTG